MRRLIALAAFVFTFLLASPLTTHAQMESQSGFEIGPRVTIDVGDIEEVAIGAGVRYDLSENVDAPLQLNGAFDYYFAGDQGGSDVTIYTIDLNGHYMLPTEATFSPYVGGGLGITNSEVGNFSNTDTGLNLVGGIEFDTGSLQPFVQGQITLGDIDRIGITGGLLFAL